MQIKGNLKDYYDHISHIYGSDSSIQYIRKRLLPLRRTSCFSYPDILPIDQKNIKQLPLTDNQDYCFKWLSVCGKYYLLVGLSGLAPPEWKILSPKLHPDTWAYLNAPRSFYREPRSTADYLGVFSDSLVELSRKVNAPVFTFTKYRYKEESVVYVDSEIPNLGNLGMSKIVTPEQMYQELSYFMGNIIKESPDVSPPTKMTDKEKITQHGFDNRISFRHRV